MKSFDGESMSNDFREILDLLLKKIVETVELAIPGGIF